MMTLLVIVFLQIVYVSMMTTRFILMIKGIRYVAALMSAVEIGIYVIAFKIVLDHLNEPINLMVYCLSYGLGILVGTKIEERLALGYITMQVVTKKTDIGLAEQLREKGYGVTSWNGEGQGGSHRTVLTIVIHRKKQSILYQYILSKDPEVFIVSYEPKHFHGGFLTK
jgi:uncharacterized protein YebE (UPF0316 family)